MDGSTKAVLILFLLIGFGAVVWLIMRKSLNDKPHTPVVPGGLDTDLCADTLPGYKRMFKGEPCYAKTQGDCDDGYTYMNERCCKAADAFGDPTIDPKTGECMRNPKPCNPKDPIKYSVYEYDSDGKCVFSKCMPTYKYNSKIKACVPTASDPLFLDCMANTKDFVKVSGSPRPSDPNKAREWDGGQDAYCDTLTARSPTETISGKYYNGTCYVSINQKCKKYPKMDNVGRFDDSTAGGPKDTSEAICQSSVDSWKEDCN